MFVTLIPWRTTQDGKDGAEVASGGSFSHVIPGEEPLAGLTRSSQVRHFGVLLADRARREPARSHLALIPEGVCSPGAARGEIA